MYDDLARTQNPTPLEWFVVHAVIPSVLVTAAFHWNSPIATAAATAPTSGRRAWEARESKPGSRSALMSNLWRYH